MITMIITTVGSEQLEAIEHPRAAGGLCTMESSQGLHPHASITAISRTPKRTLSATEARPFDSCAHMGSSPHAAWGGVR